MRKFLSVFICIIMVFTFSSCSNLQKLQLIDKCIVKNVEYYEKQTGFDNKKTAFEFYSEKYDCSTLNFKYNKIEKNTFYEISAYVFADELYTENDSFSVGIKYNCKDDINSESVKSKSINENTISDGEYYWIKITRTVFSYESESLNFSLFIGREENMVKGSVIVDKICVKSINDNKDFVTISSEDDSIEFIFYKSDFSVSKSSIEKYADFLSKCRHKLKYFVNDDFTDGKTVFLFTEDFEEFGKAGKPVFISKKQVDNVFNSVKKYNEKNECDKICFAMIHEMSHTFDRICGNKKDLKWNFDSEFLANIKALYAINKTDCKINDEIIELFNSYNAEENYLYSDEYLTKKFLTIVNEDGWNGLIMAVRELNEIDKNMKGNLAKFIQFVNCFNKFSNKELKTYFSENEWNMIIDYYQLCE